MSIHTAESIAAEAARRLGLCQVALGAETDIGLNVYQGLRVVSDDKLPCVVLHEGDDSVSSTGTRAQVRLAQRYLALGYIQCDPLNPSVAAHRVIRDIKRALFADARWSGMIRSIKYLGRDVGPRADGAGFVVGSVEFEVEYVEDLSNPGDGQNGH